MPTVACGKPKSAAVVGDFTLLMVLGHRGSRANLSNSGLDVALAPERAERAPDDEERRTMKPSLASQR